MLKKIRIPSSGLYAFSNSTEDQTFDSGGLLLSMLKASIILSMLTISYVSVLKLGRPWNSSERMRIVTCWKCKLTTLSILWIPSFLYLFCVSWCHHIYRTEKKPQILNFQTSELCREHILSSNIYQALLGLLLQTIKFVNKLMLLLLMTLSMQHDVIAMDRLALTNETGVRKQISSKANESLHIISARRLSAIHQDNNIIIIHNMYLWNTMPQRKQNRKKNILAYRS